MAERRRRRIAGLFAATTLALVVAGTSSAAPADWAGSAFADPFDDGQQTMTTPSFPISGTFVKTRLTPGVGRLTVPPTADYTLVDTDGSPKERETPIVGCPATGTLALPGGSTTADGNGRAQRSFTIAADQSTWPCNGRYAVTLTGRSTDPRGDETYPMTAVATVAVRPVPVGVIDLDVDDEADEVTVTFEKLGPDDLAPDALGYRIERAGPADNDGVYGFYDLVGDPIPVDGEPVLVDEVEAFGDFRYRVMSVRSGPDGPVFAPIEGTAVAEATITPNPGDPTTTTTRPRSTTATTSNVPRIGSGRPVPTIPTRPGASLPAPPTTIDPGFDPELDYDGAPRLPSDSPELAGEEGLSYIQNEGGAGPGLVAPVAGALVLLGWAGHVVYLNKLAKQF